MTRFHSRSIIRLDIPGHTVIGTHHRPGANTPASPQTPGVLFFNAGPAPRAGNSDLSAHACDHLATLGYHALRVDLPGLGDSSGESPLDILAYWNSVLAGRNDDAAVAIATTIREQLGIHTLIAGGLCAGAVPAIRAAQRQTPGIAGLFMLEPNFRLGIGIVVPPPAGTPPTPREPDAEPSRMRRRFHRLLRILHIERYPLGSNIPFIDEWRDTLIRGIPTLAVVARGQAAHAYLDMIERTLPVRARKSIHCQVLDGTNHIFTTGSARADSIAALEKFLLDRFPIARST